MSKSVEYTSDQVRAMLWKMIKVSAGSIERPPYKNQTELAEAIGISGSSFNQILNSVREPNTKVLEFLGLQNAGYRYINILTTPENLTCHQQ